MVAVGLLWFVAQLLRHWGGSYGLTFGIWLGSLWDGAARVPARGLPADAARGAHATA